MSGKKLMSALTLGKKYSAVLLYAAAIEFLVNLGYRFKANEWLINQVRMVFLAQSTKLDAITSCYTSCYGQGANSLHYLVNVQKSC